MVGEFLEAILTSGLYKEVTLALQICPTKPKLNVSKTHPLLIQIPKISAAIWIPPKPKRTMIARKLELEEIWRDLNLLQVKYFTFYKIYKDISRDPRSTLQQAHESSGILKFKLRYLPLSVNLLFNEKESHIYFLHIIYIIQQYFKGLPTSHLVSL